MFTLFYFDKLCFEHFHCIIPVLELWTLCLAWCNDACWYVGKSYGWWGFVDVLSACTACTINVHFNVLRTDIYFDCIVYFRHNVHCWEWRVSASWAVERWDTHKSVYSCFAFKIAISVFTLHDNGGTLHASLCTLEIIKSSHFEAVAFTPFVIHPEKHFAPILRLSSACSCMKVDDSVVVIILACEQSVKLCGVKTLF